MVLFWDWDSMEILYLQTYCKWLSYIINRHPFVNISVLYWQTKTVRQTHTLTHTYRHSLHYEYYIEKNFWTVEYRNVIQRNAILLLCEQMTISHNSQLKTNSKEQQIRQSCHIMNWFMGINIQKGYSGLFFKCHGEINNGINIFRKFVLALCIRISDLAMWTSAQSSYTSSLQLHLFWDW